MSKAIVPHYLRCDYDLPILSAIQALARGEATPDQQRKVLDWLINTAAGTYGQTFMVEGDRETAFAEGRRFVGRQCVKLLHLSPNVLRKAQNHE